MAVIIESSWDATVAVTKRLGRDGQTLTSPLVDRRSQREFAGVADRGGGRPDGDGPQVDPVLGREVVEGEQLVEQCRSVIPEGAGPVNR